MPSTTRSRPRGRPSATTHAEIERVAFELFAADGFDGTTVDDIAEAVGVGRRTLFRYFDSKNDIPWGRFDESLSQFAELLRSGGRTRSLAETVHRAVIAFNDFPVDAVPSHRSRMRLILDTPALQAHSAVKHRQWRQVIADFVAERTGAQPDDLGPRTVGHVSLALSMAAYEQWLADPQSDLLELLDDAMSRLRAHLIA